MDLILYAIIADLVILFVLFIMLIVTLISQKSPLGPSRQTEPPVRRCATCGQILEQDWKRCPFCGGPEKENPAGLA